MTIPVRRLDRPRPIPRRTGCPDPATVLPALATAVVEAMVGRRPLGQLQPLVSPTVHLRLAMWLRRQHASGGMRGLPPQVRSSCGDWVNDDVFEGTVLVDHGRRVTALAVRMERFEHRWRVTELAGPEFNLAPVGRARRTT